MKHDKEFFEDEYSENDDESKRWLKMTKMKTTTGMMMTNGISKMKMISK